MKKNTLLFFIFISVLFLAFSDGHHQTDNIMRIGCTQLNGSGCVCHGLHSDPDVHTWIGGPDTLYAGQTALYRAYLCGGPAISGGYNSAVRFGSLDTVGILSDLIVGELTQAFPQLFPAQTDTINWPFLYTAPDSVNLDTIYSVGLSSNNDGNPLVGDFWNFAPKFPVIVLNSVVPVELISFYANQSGNSITLNWSTASEINNKGFFVEKSPDKKEWISLGFVNGNGTTTEKHSYSYLDRAGKSSIYYYRLRQIDYNGNFTTSKIINVLNNTSPKSFTLEQNFPNPFNPTTTINFNLPQSSNVKLKIFDLTGRQVAEIINRNLEAGSHAVQFSPSNKLASGIYIYSLITPQVQLNKKMIYLK